MDFPEPPAGSDLLERIGAFLPQLKEANDQLRYREGIQIDGALQKDEASGDSDDEPVGDGEQDCNKTDEQPTIELKVELGDVERNKEVFDLLSSNVEDKPEKADLKGESVSSERDRAVARLLRDGDELIQRSKSKKQKVLIEDMS